MPFALVIVGLILIVSGAKNTYQQLGARLVGDFTGPGNFGYWIVSIVVLGALGYVPQFKRVSHLLLALVIVVMVIKNGGLFDKINSFLQNGPVTPKAASNDNSSTVTTNSTSGNVVSTISAIAPLAALA